jgi:transcriptional regulator GlxA family with amidase domain
MTDFRALCADLLRELDHASAWDYQQTLKDQARAALAEPQPAADGEVAELVAWLRDRAEGNARVGAPTAAAFLTRAAELLEQLAGRWSDG